MIVCCPRCGRLVEEEDLYSWRVCEATRMEPEEWDDGCVACAPDHEGDRDEDNDED